MQGWPVMSEGTATAGQIIMRVEGSNKHIGFVARSVPVTNVMFAQLAYRLSRQTEGLPAWRRAARTPRTT